MSRRSPAPPLSTAQTSQALFILQAWLSIEIHFELLMRSEGQTPLKCLRILKVQLLVKYLNSLDDYVYLFVNLLISITMYIFLAQLELDF